MNAWCPDAATRTAALDFIAPEAIKRQHNAMPDLRRTALYAFHARHGARFVDFAGWDMPVQYRSILEEHRAVRGAVGLFDVSHMGELEVRGGGAGDFLNRILTNDITRLKPGRALYTLMCLPTGGVVDDLLVYCLGPDEFFLCLNASNTAKDIDWIRAQAAPLGFTGSLVDVSDKTSLLAVQGPRSAEVLSQLAGPEVIRMKPFDVQRATIASVPAIVARTGYTGEDGFELFLDWSDGPAVADALLAQGGSRGMIPCGLGARDSLRTEAGYPLYGHEIDAEISPIQAGLSWTVKFQKSAPFIGKEALQAQLDHGVADRVVWFRTGDRRIVRPGSAVHGPAGSVGRVLSGTLSPVLEESIGSALVRAEAVSQPLFVDLRGNQVALKVVAPPLVALKKG